MASCHYDVTSSRWRVKLIIQLHLKLRSIWNIHFKAFGDTAEWKYKYLDLQHEAVYTKHTRILDQFCGLKTRWRHMNQWHSIWWCLIGICNPFLYEGVYETSLVVSTGVFKRPLFLPPLVFGRTGAPSTATSPRRLSQRDWWLAFLVTSFARRFLDFHLLIHDIAYHITYGTWYIEYGKMMYVS